MNYIQQIERLQRLIKLIEQEKTGTPEELAQRIGMSKRQLHNQLDAIRNMGATVEFCKRSNTYLFIKTKLNINFSLTLIKEDENRKIYGGIIRKRKGCNFISLYENTLAKPKGWNKFSSV